MKRIILLIIALILTVIIIFGKQIMEKAGPASQTEVPDRIRSTF